MKCVLAGHQGPVVEVFLLLVQDAQALDLRGRVGERLGSVVLCAKIVAPLLLLAIGIQYDTTRGFLQDHFLVQR